MIILKKIINHILSYLCILCLFLIQCTSQPGDLSGDNGSAPVLIEFKLTSSNSTMDTAIFFDLNAGNNDAVAGWLVSELVTRPAASGPGWQVTKPVSFTFESTTDFTLKRIFAWAKNTGENISEPLWVYVEYNKDDDKPVLSTFLLADNNLTNDPTVPVMLEGSDNSGTVLWYLSESPAPPEVGDPGVTRTLPASFTFSGTDSGFRNVYAWALDAQGNKSDPQSLQIELDLAVPTITDFSLTSNSVTGNRNITFSLDGTDSYLSLSTTLHWIITETGAPPSFDDQGWSSDGIPPAGHILSAGSGAKTVYAWVKDEAGNITSSAPLTVFLDEDEPLVTTFSLTSSALTSNPAITFNLNGSDNDAIVGWLINESATEPDPDVPAMGTWTANAVPPASYTFNDIVSSGTKTVFAWAKDAAGNVSAPVSIFVEYDIIMPVLSGFSLTNANPTANENITFTLDGTDNIGVVAWMINESETMPGAGDSGWNVTKPAVYSLSVGSGTKIVYAWGKDDAGNVSNSVSLSVEYDVDSPVLDSFVLTSSNPTADPNITFAVSGSDNVAITGWLINESSAVPDPGTPAMGTWTVNGTPPVSYTFDDTATSETKNVYIWAKDAVGNVSDPLPVAVVYDGESPSILGFSLTSVTPTSNPAITFNLDGSDNYAIAGWLINESETEPDPDAPAMGVWTTGGTPPVSYTLDDTLNYGNRTIYAWAKDGAGNVSAPQSLTVNYQSDLLAPTLSVFSLTSPSPTGNPEITFDLEGTDNILITGWMINESASAPDPAGAGWLAVKPAAYGLSSGAGTKTVYAWAKDYAGIVSASLSFSVELLTDSAPPEITAFTLTSSDPSYVPGITFTLAGTDNYIIAGWLINESPTPPDPVAPATGTWTTDGTPPTIYNLTGDAGTKTVYAWAKDGQGNVNAAGPGTSLEVFYEPTPLTLSGFTVDSIADTTATISWTTDILVEGSSSYIDYGINTDYSEGQEAAGAPGQFLTSHSVTLGSLSRGVKYYFRITVENPVGGDSATGSFITAFQPGQINPGTAVKDDGSGNSNLVALQNTIASGPGDGSSYVAWKSGSAVYASYFDDSASPLWTADGDSIDVNSRSNNRIFTDRRGSAVITLESSGSVIYAKRIFNSGGSVGYAGNSWGSNSSDTGIIVGSGTKPSATLACKRYISSKVFATPRTATMDIPANPFYDFSQSFSGISTDDVAIDIVTHNGTTVTRSANFDYVLGQANPAIVIGNGYKIGDHTNTYYDMADKHCRGFLMFCSEVRSNDNEYWHYTTHAFTNPNANPPGWYDNLSNDDIVQKVSGNTWGYVTNYEFIDGSFLADCATHSLVGLESGSNARIQVHWNITLNDNDWYNIYDHRLSGTAEVPPANPLFDSSADFSSGGFNVQTNDVIVNVTQPGVARVNDTFALSNQALGLSANIMNDGNSYYILRLDDPDDFTDIKDTGTATATTVNSLEDSTRDYSSTGSNVNVDDVVYNIITDSYAFVVSTADAGSGVLTLSSDIFSSGDRYLVFSKDNDALLIMFAWESDGNIMGKLVRQSDGADYSSTFTICDHATNTMQTASVVPDGEGGSFVIYEDSTSGEIYGKRLNSAGTIVAGGAQGLRGTLIGSGTIRDVLSDGTNGAYVLYENSGTISLSLRDLNLVESWSGAVSFTGTDAVMVLDNLQNPIIAYQNAGDIYVRRLDASGNGADLYAPAEIDLDSSTSDILQLSIAPDGANGAIISWADDRFLAFHDYLIFSQAVDVFGNLLWDADSAAGSDYSGIAIGFTGTDNTSEVFNTMLFYNDGGTPYGGLYLWFDYRNSRSDIFYVTYTE